MHFTEKLVYLPHCYQVNDDRRVEPGAPPPRNSFGLPTAGFVFASFNSTHKITPDMFAIWLRLLRKVPGSALWLLRRTIGQKTISSVRPPMLALKEAD